MQAGCNLSATVILALSLLLGKPFLYFPIAPEGSNPFLAFQAGPKKSDAGVNIVSAPEASSYFSELASLKWADRKGFADILFWAQDTQQLKGDTQGREKSEPAG